EERVDDAERAAQVLDEYVAALDLTPADRAEAEREKRLLAARPSTLTITTTPPDAEVTIDGQRAPRTTPFSVEIAAGVHTVDVRRPGYVPWTKPVDARFGRAVIVALYLARADK
ncbi:MAG TPA: PEGA domain-containing protein, partial [Polyangia bacterium]|nr:PEGA domain-containing protein [Polyangia bacterium]